ncbi:MAG: thermonuclease family protein [Candidatus Aenigmatarchaeota archaeon]
MKININLVLVIIFIVSMVIITIFRGYLNVPKNDPSLIYHIIVVDGDTLNVLINGSEKTVRLIGVNAPEKGQYYWLDAKNKLQEIINDYGIVLESDSGTPNTDIYGRLLRYVISNGTNVNVKMIEDGYAKYYPLNQTLRYALDMSSAEKNAQSNNIGIWPMVNISCMGITIFNYNPRGDDRTNLVGEYVIFKNNCEHDLNISEWTVINKNLEIFTFPGCFLIPGAKIELNTGNGNNSFSKYNSVVYWNRSQSVWSNSGDTLVMYDIDGNIILNYSY